MTRDYLAIKFITESNHIEGITRPLTPAEMKEFMRFMALKPPTVEDLVQFVSVYQPDAKLRDNYSVPGVRVGKHIAPPSGPQIRESLQTILDNARSNNSWQTHLEYETLHPFTDGNGRSGRMLWAWQRNWEGIGLGFLHMFYYQTLENQR